MHGLIKRIIEDTVKQRLEHNPSIALLDAHQVGKSTLAEQIIKEYPIEKNVSVLPMSQLIKKLM